MARKMRKRNEIHSLRDDIEAIGTVLSEETQHLIQAASSSVSRIIKVMRTRVAHRKFTVGVHLPR